MCLKNDQRKWGGKVGLRRNTQEGGKNVCHRNLEGIFKKEEAIKSVKCS